MLSVVVNKRLTPDSCVLDILYCSLCRNYVFSGWSNCFFAINVGILQNFGQTSSTRRAPIPRPDGWDMGVIPVLCGEKWPWYIRNVLYRGVYHRISRLVFLRRRCLMYNRYQCTWLRLVAGIQVTWHIFVSNGYWTLNVGSSPGNVFLARNHDTRQIELMNPCHC